MENFTPLSALIGGALIGGAATLLLILNGRIAGIAGILGGLLPAEKGDATWRLLFLAGLVIGAFVYAALSGGAPLVIDATVPMLIAGGLITGFGARLGGGCTSGHGVCGLGRLSARSLAATCVFMAATFVTVLVVRHVIGG
ncbi:MAG: YeeE/YedE family protein [Proteobacteria bacterium]|nr:MAG: YeeE/YedE family protein [Pseudomonadota bacterium]